MTALPPRRSGIARKYPDTWTDKYTEADRADTLRILDWLATPQTRAGFEHQRTESKLAKAVGVSPSTVNSILGGVYPSPPRKHLDAMLSVIEREAERDDTLSQIPLIETSVYKMAALVCRQAHHGRDFGVLSGEVGVGKTTALKEYARRNPRTAMYMRGTPNMNATVWNRVMVSRTGAHVHKANKYSHGNRAEQLAGLIEHFAGRDMLFILDEADKVADSTLEDIRALSDEAEIGVVLAGTERLRGMIEGDKGRHGQISSRVGFWPPVIRGISREDSDAIVNACFPAANDDVRTAAWEMCSAKARVLGKLLRNVDELVRHQGHTLAGPLVIQAGQQLMGLRGGR